MNNTQRETKTISIRKVCPETLKKLKTLAALHGVPVGKMLENLVAGAWRDGRLPEDCA